MCKLYPVCKAHFNNNTNRFTKCKTDAQKKKLWFTTKRLECL